MRHYIMNMTFKVGTGELRDSRIKRIEEVLDEFNLEYEKENYDEIEVIYYFPKMSTNYESFEKLIEARKKLIEDTLTINTIKGLYQPEFDFYDYTKIKKSINKEIRYDYGTCYRMIEGKRRDMFSGQHIEMMQFLLNKGLIKCRIIEKEYTPKNYIHKLTNGKYEVEDTYGKLKRYISDEYKITVATTSLPALYIINSLIKGYRFVSYTNMHKFAIEYTAETDFLKYILNHKEEFDLIAKGYQRNFTEAYGSNYID